jgi:hypothetical protein
LHCHYIIDFLQMLEDALIGVEFMLGVAFGDSSVSVAAKLVQSFAMPF